MENNLKVIPIFFAVDDAYVPYLAVALESLIKNSSKNYYYASADETVWKQLANLMNRINEIIDEISEKECSKSEIEIEY